MFGKLKSFIARKKWDSIQKEHIAPLVSAWAKEGRMGNIGKGLGAAAIGGAAGALTDILTAGIPQTLEDLQRTAVLVVGGALLAAATYLKGLYTPVPAKPVEAPKG